MKRIWSFVVVLMSVIVFMGVNIQSVWAASANVKPSGNWDREANKPATWSEEQKKYVDEHIKSTDYAHLLQTDERWCWVYLEGHTIGKWGCNLTCSTMFCMMADPSIRNVEDWGPDYAYHNEYLDSNAHPKEKAPIEVAETIDIKGRTYAEIDSVICNQLDKGYYVTIWCVSGSITGWHFVPVIGENNGVPVVWDVFYARDTYPETDKSSPLTSLESLICYKAKEGYEKFDKDAANRAIAESKKISDSLYANGYGDLVSEWELTGMPSPSGLLENQLNVTLPDGSNLTQKEQNTIGVIKDNMNADKTTAYEVLHTVFTVAGLILIVYAIFLILAFIFDRVNVFFDFSLVGFLSFGKIKVLTGTDYGDVIPEGYISHKLFFVRVGLIFVVGALLVSGVVPRLVKGIVGLFM